jgi:hypothetical protein
MRQILQATSFIALMFGLSVNHAAGQTEADEFRQWIEYRDGEISLDFDRTPVEFALYAIQARTGFQIVIPASSDARLLNLRLRRQPFEPAMRSLISTIGYENFAVVYDNSGRPSRALVLNAQPAARTAEEAAKTEPARQPLSAEERDKLQKELSRWRELKQEERSKIETRLKSLPANEDKERLVSEYGRQVLELERR